MASLCLLMVHGLTGCSGQNNDQDVVVIESPGKDSGSEMPTHDMSSVARDATMEEDLTVAPMEDMPSTPDAAMLMDATMSDMSSMPEDLGEMDMASLTVAPGPRSVATFNVELFFDTECDTGGCDADSFEQVPSMIELMARYQETGAAIARMDADVLVLQELEKEHVFESLVAASMVGYKTLAFGETGAPGSIDVAIATKGELIKVERHRESEPLMLEDGSQSRFARELLEVHTRIDGAYVVVFGAHFISKVRPTNTVRRVAEAKKAAELAGYARTSHPDALIVLAGDLNDTPDSGPLLALEEGGFRLTSEGRALEEVYTNVYGFDLQLIDHVLYLETPNVTFSQTDGLEVFRDEGAHGFAGSDHAAAKATFVWQE